MKLNILTIITVLFFALSCENAKNPHSGDNHSQVEGKADTTVHYKQEKHLKNIKQLTNGGDNAEAYFSFNNEMITFQAKKS
jgi:hypothetical protein